ncbi:MAG: hypothetical protein KJ914_05955 [Gammaproteobacteria bacterium]|nr:hypothetical protein [Gammaproteobacteria bacterium]MBU1725515.1 hypothetical protein [Gammaproteobacteria bacterium]MBU2007373.1 hypothetical protein [Gammaproteobacteria bacterium]
MEYSENLWPKHDYYQQVEKLRAMLGQPLYIVEINTTDINAGVHFPGTPLRLLAVVDFPQPDPYKQLCPHMLILEDGRGINLGRIARISTHSAYSPAPENILFSNHEFVQNVLLAPRSLSRESVAATTRAALARMFGDTPGKFLQAHAEPRTKHDKLDALPQADKKP